MKRKTTFIVVSMLVSFLCIGIYLGQNVHFNETKNGLAVDGEPEPQLQNETIPENESTCSPKFHIFNFEFHEIHQSGSYFWSPAWVSFYIQNIGNGNATEIVVSFNLTIGYCNDTYFWSCYQNIALLEPAETQYFEVDVGTFGSNLLELNEGSVKIECAEGITEEFELYP